MRVKRFYNINFFELDFYKSIDICIVGHNSEERTKHIPSLWYNKFKGPVYSFNYSLENEKYTLEQVQLPNTLGSMAVDTEGRDITTHLYEDLVKLNIDGKRIFIDITGIKQPAFFFLLKLLKENIRLSSLLVGYTEPEKYLANPEQSQDSFELTESFYGIRAIPGFIRIPQIDKEKLLIVLMGFEGKRFTRVYDEINPSKDKTYSIIGFPSFKPGWQYYTYGCNQKILEHSKSYRRINRAIANEPFSVYNFLSDIKHTNTNSQLVVAPIGTKPHSLGAVLFAINNQDTRLIYDFPSIKMHRTIGKGKCFVYNIMSLLYE